MNKKIEADGRLFNIHMIRAKNGCFLIVCEGEEMKLGSMALSLKIDNRASSSIIIPSKFEDVYSRIFSESISMMIDGIVIASLYTITPIDAHIAKRLLEEIKELCKT
ncbi:MAG: hypothetical protein ACPLY9_02425 [Nitrososphaerales archaeon]